MCGLLFLLAWGLVKAETTLVLTKEFIEKYKNRATIEVDFAVMYAHKAAKKPSPSHPSNDGDIHIAGVPRAISQPNDVIMAAVAEIMNAKDFPKVLKYIQEKKNEAGNGAPVRMMGVWRFWPEHGGESHHTQGHVNVSAIEDTNPDHILEIHPLTRVDAFDLTKSFKPIPDFKTKNAEDAFSNYERGRFHIQPSQNTIRMRMSKATYNYVEFKLQLLEDPTNTIDDGLTLFGRARDLDGETQVQKRRMVFVAGTRPEQTIRKLKKGQCMHALGMPRVSLTLVSWRVACSTNDQTHPGVPGDCSIRYPDVLDWGMPYEMVILADYGGSRNCSTD